MDIWNVLGIAATADRAAIQAAYRSKLTETNPEDKPEEFKQLRAAYEQALALAKKASTSEAPMTEGERWQQKAAAIYEDIARRRNSDCWHELLNDDFCMNLATRAQARDLLLRYLMGHYFLPRAVWQLLDSFFALEENHSELKEAFPPDFIENAVIAGIHNDELLSYDQLEGTNCDEYMRSYSRFRSALAKSSAADMEQAVQQMENSGAFHPYTLYCKARLALVREPAEPEQAQTLADQLAEYLPNDLQTMMLQGDCAMHREDYAAAEEIWRKLLEVDPAIAQARFNQIECLIALDRYQEAKDLSIKLHKRLPNHPVVSAQLHAINTVMLPRREKLLQDEPDNVENMIELAWCYNQERRTADALRVLKLLPAQDMQGEYEYENLASKVYLGNDMPKQALPHLRRWERAIRLLPDTEENAEKKVRLPEAIRLQALVYENLKQEDDAEQLYSLLAEQYPDDPDVLLQRTQRSMRQRDYETALQCAERVSELTPHEGYCFFLLGCALYHLHRLQDSYNAFHDAMDRAGRDMTCLMYQCRILMDVGQWEDAQQLLEEINASGIDTPMLDYVRGRAAQHEARYGDAQELFTKASENLHLEEGQPDYAGEVFYRLAGLQTETATKERLLELVNEGLQYEPDGLSLLEMKADLLRQMSRTDEAIQVLQRVLELAPRHRYIYESLGRLYQYTKRDYANALECYRRQIEIEDSAVVRNLLGLALQQLGRFEESRAEFLCAIRMDPDRVAYEANLAGLCLAEGKPEQAEQHYLKALDYPDLSNETRARLRHDLSRLYARQERMDEALQLLQQNIDELHEYDNLLEQAECHARRGDLAAAFRALDRWRTLTNADECDYLQNKADYLLKNHKPKKAMFLLLQAAGRSHNALHTLAYTCACMGWYRISCLLMARALKLNPEHENSYSWYAKALLWQGKRNAAEKAAEKGLELLEQDKYKLDKAMYFTRKSAYLAILGRIEEAQEALRTALAAPLCRFCAYGGCKDALWDEGFVLECAGDLTGAMRLYTEGAEKYPDEFDFIAGIERLKKRKQ